MASNWLCVSNDELAISNDTDLGGQISAIRKTQPNGYRQTRYNVQDNDDCSSLKKTTTQIYLVMLLSLLSRTSDSKSPCSQLDVDVDMEIPV